MNMMFHVIGLIIETHFEALGVEETKFIVISIEPPDPLPTSAFS